jgi:hypothetical protein
MSATYTAVTGTIASYAGGILTAVFQAPAGTSQFAYLNQGFPLAQTVTLNGSGVFSMSLADTGTVNIPGALWRFYLSSAGPNPVSYTVATAAVTGGANLSVGGYTGQ